MTYITSNRFGERFAAVKEFFEAEATVVCMAEVYFVFVECEDVHF
jgi:hypothetical protein